MSDFRREVIEGLSARPRSLPCKYLYDAKGSRLFEKICETDDYYVTRADLEIHHTYLKEIAQSIGPNAHIIEFGSGAGIKTRLLLQALQEPRAYSPIEISSSALQESISQLAQEFPSLEILPLLADYTQSIDPEALVLDPPARRRVVYFPGSTIGNFPHDQARDFLGRMRHIARTSGAVLIGVDLMKSVDILLKAYDDSQGVTAKFNKNLLNRLQTELGAQLCIDDFDHEARFNQGLNRVEMHLVAVRDTCINLGDQEFHLSAGETIHTESSHKYSIEAFTSLAAQAGLSSITHWMDSQQLFSMHYLVPDGQ